MKIPQFRWLLRGACAPEAMQELYKTCALLQQFMEAGQDPPGHHKWY